MYMTKQALIEIIRSFRNPLEDNQSLIKRVTTDEEIFCKVLEAVHEDNPIYIKDMLNSEEFINLL